jgi:hypothetical protein
MSLWCLPFRFYPPGEKLRIASAGSFFPFPYSAFQDKRLLVCADFMY